MADKDFEYGSFVAKTREDDAVKIDDGSPDGTWYSVQVKIRGFLKNFKKGDKVKFKVNREGKKKSIYLLYKAEGEAPTSSEPTPEEPMPQQEQPQGKPDAKKGKPGQEYWDKRNASIVRQSYIRSAAIAIPALGNIADTEALSQMIITVAEQLLKWEAKQANK